MKKVTPFIQLQILFFALLLTSFTYAQVGIGTNTPTSTLEVDGSTTDAVYGHSDNVGGYLGRETNIVITDLFGTNQTILGSGVYANNPTAGYTSLFGQSSGMATVAASINFSDVWIGSYNYANNTTDTFNYPALYAQYNHNSASLAAFKSAFLAFSTRGTTSGNPGYTVGGEFIADAQNEDAYGLRTAVFSDRSGGGGPNTTDLAGGEFAVLNYAGTTVRSAAWVANYVGTTDFKILGGGTVSTIVEDQNNTPRIMFAPEAPEVLFQDYGTGKLVNGVAQITIDPILSRNIHVDEQHPLKVFIQLEGDCNGVYVTNKSTYGFTVKELQNGQSNVDFSYQIVANRKDRESGDLLDKSNFQDLRFPEFNKPKNSLNRKREKRALNSSKEEARPKNN